MASSHSIVSDPFTITLIRVKARQLCRRTDFSRSDYDELRQGMRLYLLEKAHLFDPERGNLEAFVTQTIKTWVAMQLRYRNAVLFATRKIITKTEEGGFGRERTIAAGLGKDSSGGGGERILRTVGSPACVAKNRFDLPAELPLSWPALMQALTQQPQPPGIAAKPHLRLVVADQNSDNSKEN